MIVAAGCGARNQRLWCHTTPRNMWVSRCPLNTPHIWLVLNGATVRGAAAALPGSLCTNYKLWTQELGESGDLWLEFTQAGETKDALFLIMLLHLIRKWVCWSLAALRITHLWQGTLWFLFFYFVLIFFFFFFGESLFKWHLTFWP